MMTTGFNSHDTTQAAPSLQSVILNQALSYVSKYPYYNTEFTAPLEAVTNAVESAYVLTAKADLPKVTKVFDLSGRGLGLTYYFDGSEDRVRAISNTTTAEYARKVAAEWLAIAKHLEQEEATKAYEEAKAKAVADVAANAAAWAQGRRLDELADEWFGNDFVDLSPNKAAAVTEIHRLETQLNAKDAA